jgi:tetratricopeptide (TPR) repeat protein
MMKMMNVWLGVLFSVVFVSALSAAPSRSARAEPEEAREVTAFNEGTKALFALRYAEAERQLRAAVRHRETFAEAHNNLAFVLRKQGADRFGEALQHYDRAIELNPGLAEAYMYRGVLYVQMADPEKAAADLETLRSLNANLAAELEWVIANGREKEPEQFFGVVR